MPYHCMIVPNSTFKQLISLYQYILVITYSEKNLVFDVT